MPLSNYIPSSRINQPGVCTSATRPTAPYEGQVIYETDTNRVLVWDAAAWVIIADTDSPPGIQLVGRFTSTNQTTLTCDNIFSSDFKNYRVIVNISGTQDLNLVYMRYLNSSGTEVATSYYSHALGWDYATSGSTSPHVFNRTDGVSILFLANAVSSTQNRSNASFDIYDPFTASSATYSSGTYAGINSGAYFSGGLTSGSYLGAVSMRGIRFLNSTNTNMSCDVSVYGYRQ